MGRAIYIGEALFCLTQYLSDVRIQVGSTVIVIEKTQIIKFVKILQAFLNQSDRTETHILGNIVVRAESEILKLGTITSEPINIKLDEIRQFMAYVKRNMKWIFRDLPFQSFLFINNFVVLMSEIKRGVSIGDIMKILGQYDQFSSEVIEITLIETAFAKGRSFELGARAG